MFVKEITFYTDELVNKITDLQNTGYFKTVREIYITAGLVGILFDEYNDGEYSKKGATKKIFSGELNRELDVIKHISTIASLLKLSEDDKLLMNKAFGDWYDSIVIDSTSKPETEKYDIFYNYSLAGIKILHETIAGKNPTDSDQVFLNIKNFINKIESLEEGSERFKVIEDHISNF